MTHFGLNYNFIFPQAFRLMYDMCITENMNMMNSTTAIYPQRDAEKPFPQNVQLISGELWYSYLQRLSIALGYVHFRGFIEDYGNHNVVNYWGHYVLPRYDCNWKDLDFGFSLPADDLFLRTSLYPGLAPLMSRVAQARYVNSFYSFRRSVDVLGASVHPLVTQLCRCPECYRECKEEFGSPAYLRNHNMPGVTVCWRHGCPLERFVGKRGYEFTQDCFETVDGKPNAMEYAQFCTDLLNSNIQCCLQDVVRGIKPILLERYGINTAGDCSALPEESWVNAYGQSLAKVTKMLFNVYLSIPDAGALIALLLFLFGNVKELEKSISTDSPKSVFLKELTTGRYELISDYSDTYIRLRCNKCGYEFGTTPHAIVTGLGCPDCNKDETAKKLLARQFAKVGKGYKCLSKINGQTSYSRIEKKSTGEIMRCRFLEFINNGTYTSDEYTPLFRVYRNPSDRPNVRNTNESIQNELSTHGNFILEEHEIVGSHSVHKLGIRHKDCGGFFKIDLAAFRRAPICRVCQKYRYTTETYASKITEMSGGAFRLVGEYNGYNKPVTIEHIENGTIINEEPRRIRDTIERLINKPKGLAKQDRSNERKQILSRIEKSDGILFVSDFYDICDSVTLRTCLFKMAGKGLVKTPYRGVWCRTTSDLMPIQVADAMWVLRKEERLGFHFGDLLLSEIGLSIEGPKMCIASSVVGRREDTNVKTVCGQTIYVRGCDVQVTAENWTVLAAYYTIVLKEMLSNEISVDSVKKILARWLISFGKKLEDFLPYEKLFGGKHAIASVEVMAFARTLDEWANAKEESHELASCQ